MAHQRHALVDLVRGGDGRKVAHPGHGITERHGVEARPAGGQVEEDLY